MQNNQPKTYLIGQNLVEIPVVGMASEQPKIARQWHPKRHKEESKMIQTMKKITTNASFTKRSNNLADIPKLVKMN